MRDKPNRTTREPISELSKVRGVTLKAAADLAPLGGYLHDLVMLRRDEIFAAVRKNDEETLEDFFGGLFRGDERLDESVVDALIDDRDFHALIRACVADIEAEKREAYTALARSIATGRVGTSWRRHFVLSLKDISQMELTSLRSAYVAKRFDLVPTSDKAGSMVREEDFLSSDQPGSYRSIAVANLTTRGFIHSNKLSSTGEDFIRACSSDAMLEPGAMGYKQWSGQRVAIISYELDDNSAAGKAVEIEGHLRRYQIKAPIIAIMHGNLRQAQTAGDQGVLLVGSRLEGIREHAEALAQYSAKVPLVIVRTANSRIPIPSEIEVAKVIEYTVDFNVTLEAVAAAILNFRNSARGAPLEGWQVDFG